MKRLIPWALLAALVTLATPSGVEAGCVGIASQASPSPRGDAVETDLCLFEVGSMAEVVDVLRHSEVATSRRAGYVSPREADVPNATPVAVRNAVEAANSIATTLYVWGGGHRSFESSGYDCSGAVSYALHGGGLLDTPLTSGALETYGDPGPGRWITIYANADHAYAVIAGLRWDTVGYGDGVGPRWHDKPPYPDDFVVRHPRNY